MSKTQLNDMYALPDALQQTQFDLIIPNIPGGGNSRSFTIKCQSTVMPGKQLEPILIALHGFEYNRPGREVFNKTLTFTSLETVDLDTRDTMLNWMNTARSARNGTAGSTAEFATTAELVLYDNADNETRRIKMFYVWPQSLEDTPLDGTGSQAVFVSGTLSYDTFE